MSDNEPTQPADLNLRCPYCGAGFYVTTEYTGGYLGSDVPDALMCNGEVWCNAEWNTNGTLRTGPSFLRYPELYAMPEGYTFPQ